MRPLHINTNHHSYEVIIIRKKWVSSRFFLLSFSDFICTTFMCKLSVVVKRNNILLEIIIAKLIHLHLKLRIKCIEFIFSLFFRWNFIDFIDFECHLSDRAATSPPILFQTIIELALAQLSDFLVLLNAHCMDKTLPSQILSWRYFPWLTWWN